MSTKTKDIDELLQLFKNNPDELIGDEIPDEVALKKLQPVMKWLCVQGMRASEIAAWVKQRTEIDVTPRKIATYLTQKRKKASNASKKEEPATEATPAEATPAVSSSFNQ